MIDITVTPDKNPILVLWLIIDKFSDKNITIDILQPIAILTIVLEISLIEPQDTINPIDQQTISMIQLVASLPKINIGRILTDQQLPLFFHLFLTQLLNPLIRITQQQFLCFFLIRQKVLYYRLLSQQQLMIK